MEGCTATTEGMDEIIPTIISALSLGDTPEVTRSSSSTSAIRRQRSKEKQEQHGSIEKRIPSIRSSGESSNRRRRQRQQQGQPYVVEKSSTAGTEEDKNYLDVFPTIVNVFTTNDDAESNNSSTNRSQKADSYHGERKSIPPELAKVNELTRSRSYHSPSVHDTCTAQVLPSIRNALSLDNGDIVRIKGNDGVTSSLSGSQVYPFMRNVFSMDFTDTTQNSRNSKQEMRFNMPSMIDECNEDSSERGKKTRQKIVVTRAYEVKEHYLESIFYVSISAILGSVFRVYMARIFGVDCEYGKVGDFLYPLASNICVTNGGRTEQTGGALFTDLPSNFFGSFLMGMITPPLGDPRARLPWLHRDHPLQRDEVFHASLGTGFCGCLTTFASWNIQMVVMLDGSYCELGSQVITVFFGYIIGMMGALHGFFFGRQCGMWMYNFRHRNSDNEGSASRGDNIEMDDASSSESLASIDEGVELVDDDNVKLQPVPSHLHKIPLFMTAVALLIGFVIGDVVSDIEFYKGMILVWILSPVGSLLRWRLSNLNVQNKDGRINIRTSWIPWGTFTANMFATIIAACMEGLNDRYLSGSRRTSTTTKWVDSMIFALKTGVAGSLSTVSTLVKESVHLSEKYSGTAKGHYYFSMTCLSGCLLGLMVYATTIRVNK